MSEQLFNPNDYWYCHECKILPALDVKRPERLSGGTDWNVIWESRRQWIAYGNYLEAKLLSAQSRIRELEQENAGLVLSNKGILRTGTQMLEKAEAERDRLKADYKSVVDSYARLVVKHGRIAVVTETPEWFDSPCARAVREVIESK
jgi:hypothetical protein